MFKSHCSRCYRHELIYDIEWPKRKFIPKRFKNKADYPRAFVLKSNGEKLDSDVDYSEVESAVKALIQKKPRHLKKAKTS